MENVCICLCIQYTSKDPMNRSNAEEIRLCVSTKTENTRKYTGGDQFFCFGSQFDESGVA